MQLTALKNSASLNQAPAIHYNAIQQDTPALQDERAQHAHTHTQTNTHREGEGEGESPRAPSSVNEHTRRGVPSEGDQVLQQARRRV